VASLVPVRRLALAFHQEAAIAHQLGGGWKLARDRGASLRGRGRAGFGCGFAGEQVAPRASRPSRAVQGGWS